MMRNRRLALGVLVATASWMLGASLGLASQEVPGPAFKATGAADAEKLGWRLATQAWTFNNFTFFDAIDKTAEIGVKYIEAYPGQKVSKDINDKMGPDMKPESIAAVKAHLQAKGVTLVNFGVTGIPSKEADARKVFEWAKKMGIETLVTESRLDFLPKLCNEYKINIAFHNHPYSWSQPTKLLEYLKGKGPRLGGCCDTGHWMRKKIKPLDAVKMLKGKIISFHLKDLSQFGNGHDVVWGTGKGDLKDVLAELHKQGFKGVFSIEYEYKHSLADLAACVKFFNDTAKELAAQDRK